MAQQMHDFGTALNKKLPQELVDIIEDLVFTNDYSVKQMIEPGYRPPSILQVNRTYRERLLTTYYQYTPFFTPPQTDTPDIGDCWIDSIPLVVRDLVLREGSWWLLDLQSSDGQRHRNIFHLLQRLGRWRILTSCELCRLRLKYWKVFAACSGCQAKIKAMGCGYGPVVLAN